MFDGSYAFGVKNGRYDELNCCQSKGPFTVVKTGLKALGYTGDATTGEYNATADILITDNDNGFWFVPSRFTKRIAPKHVIYIDGNSVEINNESFKALRKQFLR